MMQEVIQKVESAMKQGEEKKSGKPMTIAQHNDYLSNLEAELKSVKKRATSKKY